MVGYGVVCSVCDVLTDKLTHQCENCAVTAFKGNCDCPEVQRGIEEYAREAAGRYRLDGGLFDITQSPRIHTKHERKQ